MADDEVSRYSRLPVKDARVERERYGGIEPADINEWWAPLSRAFLALLWPLKGARDDLVTLMTMSIPGVQVKRPSGLVSVPANGQWDSQSLQPLPHRVLRVTAWNYDPTNPLTLRTSGGPGGIQAGRLYLAPNQTYSFDLNVPANTIFTLDNPGGTAVNAQIVLGGF